MNSMFLRLASLDDLLNFIFELLSLTNFLEIGFHKSCFCSGFCKKVEHGNMFYLSFYLNNKIIENVYCAYFFLPIFIIFFS